MSQPILLSGIPIVDLYSRQGLEQLDELFLQRLDQTNTELHHRLILARRDPASWQDKSRSELIIELAPRLEDFLGDQFGISRELSELQASHHELAPLYAVKRKFVQRRAISGMTAEQASSIDGEAIAGELEKRFGGPLTERVFADHVSRWLEAESQYAADIDLAARYAAWATLSPAGRLKHKHGVLFKTPHKLDFAHLVPVETLTSNGHSALGLSPEHWRQRDGFKLTDPGMDIVGALDQVHYCIKCHNQAKDSCSTGLRDKGGEFRKSPLGVALAGCPLSEKISEMNVIRQRGYPVGALAIVTVDNPMAAATGHRICNDCMKSCVFQRQDPVDIPQIETETLKQVLALPWGFEIYSLLTRWNPLNFERPLPRPATGRKVLVVGLGPAGFTLAHHLMNDGHAVVGVDGLKIEPLPAEISGVEPSGRRVPFRPIYDVREIYESLDDRVMAGFGGVAEYGITVRWNKNFLKIARLLVERRREFAIYGGVRFGGAITVDRAFRLGFDHIALCAGAGRPTIVPMANGLARGVRQASDFLMALQLTGAAKRDSVANLQIRLPIVVVGGGLTAIDTATESLAYYVVQVEKFLDRYEKLVEERGEREVRESWSEEEEETAEEFLAHARALRAAQPSQRLALLNSWGGVTIAYRRRLVDAPSYTLNHEEVAKALEEGVHFAEELTPVAVEIDRHGHASGLRLKKPSGENVLLPAKSILIAAGTQPNTVLSREDPGRFHLDGRYYQTLDEDGQPVQPERVAKPQSPRVLTSLLSDGRAISFFGDLHPSFAGNVVKAMASAKQGYPVISRLLARIAPSEPSPQALISKLDEELRPTVSQVVRLTPNTVEVVVKAPMAARAFEPGQFYRLQNYETFAPRSHGATLAMEGLALTGAWVDPGQGLLSTIVLEMGGSSDLCALLKPGEPVVLMGPTGAPTHTPSRETVLLAGGGLGNAVLFSIGRRLRDLGSRVLYFAGYKKIEDRFKVEEIERAADVVVWCCDQAPGFVPSRARDLAFTGNIVEAMAAYASGQLGDVEIPLSSARRLIVIGSDGMMRAVQRARHTLLKPFLDPDHYGVASINSPMQCMMKEICAQCLQRHVDPQTGKETIVFSCFNQDQALDQVDFDVLRARLSLNGVQEKLTRLWIDRCLRQLGARRALATQAG
ncbi:MAG TPA: FAD-dependent oxidoreductase [Bryobacteraceae bacterium]|nr:FAD-dependent oxidoreductase [Bryobacteraceae bacterium]